MSLESARAFVNEATTDMAFARQLASAESSESRRILAFSRGYQFTQDEFNQAKSELSEEIYSEVVLETSAKCCPCMGCKEDAVWA